MPSTRSASAPARGSGSTPSPAESAAGCPSRAPSSARRPLVLDEPTVGLDPVLRGDLWATFADLRDDGVTLIVSSHVMNEADRCDRLVLLREGELLGDFSPAGLRAAGGSEDPDEAFLLLVRQRAVEHPGDDA